MNTKSLKKESGPSDSSSLTQFYDDLKAGVETEHHHDHHHGGPMMIHVGGPGDGFNPGAAMWRNKAAKEADCLRDKCYKHLILDVYCKILPLDDDYVAGHHGQMSSDVDAMLAGKGITPTQYLTSCYEATKSPFVNWLLRSGNHAAQQYMEDAEAELKDGQEKGIDLPEPKPASVEDEDVKQQLVDVKSDTEYETFIDKLKQKTVDKIVDDVSKIIADKKEEQGMTFDIKSQSEQPQAPAVPGTPGLPGEDQAMESGISSVLDYMPVLHGVRQ